jgi:hypothetical protein
LDLSSSGYGLTEGYYNKCNENSGSLKEREFLAKKRLLATKGLCSVDLNKDIHYFFTFPSKSFVNFSCYKKNYFYLEVERDPFLS